MSEKYSSEIGYNDFENLLNIIKTLIDNTDKYDATVKNVSDDSKEFTVRDAQEKSLQFDLNFVSYDKKNSCAKLVLKFKQNKFDIFYANKRYTIKYEQTPEEISKEVLEKILNDAFKEQRKYKENIFPDSIVVQYYDRIEYPVATEFSCPECKKGSLVIEKKEDLKVEQYKTFNEMIRNDYDGEWDYDWFNHSFAGFLTCGSCSEKIAVLGKAEYSFSESWGIPDEFSEADYKIKYFERVADFIEIDSLASDDLKKKLRESFLLYFSDENACANKIRVFLDMYLTELGVSETTKNGGFKNLSDRIKECAKLDEKQKEILEILKNVGNKGSHGGGEISKADLYKVYKCIESFIKQNEYNGNVHALEAKFSK